MTYHCDVQLPSGWFNRVADRIILAGNVVTARLVPTVVAYTRDYAEHSPVMGRVLDKVTVVPPPVEMAPPPEEAVAAFRARFDLGDGPVVGIVARFATEKGFEHLVGALPALVAEFPDLRVVHAGEFEHVIGEQGYRDRLRPTLQRFAAHWRTAGVLGGDDLAAFFAACDVTVLPSLNRTESFGFVQIESMLNGTPVVASALPGVRVPTIETGMGLTVPPGDADRPGERAWRRCCAGRSATGWRGPTSRPATRRPGPPTATRRSSRRSPTNGATSRRPGRSCGPSCATCRPSGR